MTSNASLPPRVRQKLADVRRRLWRYVRWQSLLMVTCWVLVVFWLGAAVDYLPVRTGASESPAIVRVAMLVMMALGAGWILLGWLLPRWLTPVRDASIAVLIERRRPELNNELITAVELAERPLEVVNPDAHAQMLQRVLSAAERHVQSVKPEELFNPRPLRVMAGLASLAVVFTLTMTVLHWDWMQLWSRRLFALSDQAWPRSASLRMDWLQLQQPVFTGQTTAERIRVVFENDLARIPLGSSPLLQVSADASAKLPEVCTLYYRSDEGLRGRANLRRIGGPQAGWQQFHLDGPPLDGLASAMTLDIVGLDARLRDLRVEVVDPIIITDMRLDCVYPSYLMNSLSWRAEQERLPYRSGMRIPEGTECSLVGTCNAPLGAVEYLVLSEAAGDGAAPSSVEVAEVDQATFRIPLGALSASQVVEIRLSDRFGLSSEQILRYNLLVVRDAVPEVQSRLEGIGLAISPKAYLPIRGQVTDDYGVASVAVELAVDETPLAPIPLTWNDSQLQGEVDFLQLADSGVVTLRPGMTVGLSVLATDHYDLNNQQHAGRGQPLQLAVLTEDQLLVVLDRQELELRQRLEQIISELRQLDEALQGILEELVAASASAAKVDVNQGGQRVRAVAWQPPAVQPMIALRLQQAQLQADKSRQELSSVANRVEHLRLQLKHNRVDSLDRQQRLLEQVELPLTALLAGDYARLDRHLSELQSAVPTGGGRAPCLAAIDSLDRILLTLESIKQNMLDIESFNELIDLVRTLLEEQERLLKEAEESRKSRILELFN